METISVSVKEQKEAFVTGHDGGTPLEVLIVCLSAPIGLACYRSLMGTVRPKSKWTYVIFEAFLVWFPMILCQTKYLYPYGLISLITETRLAHIFGGGYRNLYRPTEPTIHTSEQDNDNNNNNNNNESNNNKTSNGTISQKLDYLTCYRSSILYLTFIAILAVDFHVFPRRFCKTEIAGFGLMDIGAGSFCLSAGLVSPRARRRKKILVLDGNDGSEKFISSSFLKPLFRTMPLVLLGIIRIVTNRELEYQEHVSEYGVHWNFFFTMGVLALVPPLMIFSKTNTPHWLKPVIIMTTYQAMLSLGGLQEYIETAPRNCNHLDSRMDVSVPWLTACNIFAANREGILGCFGYLSLFFFGEWVGYEHVWKSPSSGSRWLWILSAILWSLLALVYWSLNISVSRRSTNIAFCLWAAGHNIFLLAFLQWSTIESTTEQQEDNPDINMISVPTVWDTVNRYGLIMFLIANLLTGLVNLTISTLEMSDPIALCIVFLYICTVSVAALLVDILWSRFMTKQVKKSKVE